MKGVAWTKIDETGNRYSKLLVLRFSHVDASKTAFFVCLCDCGTETIVRGSSLRNGNTTSCGCYKIEFAETKITHGDCVGKKTPEYMIWRAMISRCEYPKNKHFDLYGGRGITVCKRWRNNYANFLADMGRRPSPKHSIERGDNDGNYEPSNCRWATIKEQANNRSDNRILEYKGTKMTVSQWADHLGVSKNTLGMRLFRNWSIERTLCVPVISNK